ncbi:hypothetical protein NRF20_39575 [Streptomyces sp. R-74717]
MPFLMCQLGPGVRESDPNPVQRKVQLLGDHHGDRGGHALAHLCPGHRERGGAVRVHLDRDQARSRRGRQVLQIAEVEEVLGLRRRRHGRLGLLPVERVGAEEYADSKGRGGKEMGEHSAAAGAFGC